jgi:phage repressor protein C with HTH and peptisase S24 domain
MGQHLTTGQLIPDAGWREYVRWLLGRRRRFVVRENSMVPTLMPGDTVLAEMGGSVEVGDIALVCWAGGKPASGSRAQLPTQATVHTSSPGRLLVKRVGEVFYDGGVYLISDNANEPNARDSRHFGVIAANRIIGRVTSRLASLP